MKLTERVVSRARVALSGRWIVSRRFPDFDARTVEIIERVAPYTMTSPQRIAALCDAIRHVEAHQIEGAFVECGVWKGGSSMAAALAFTTPRPLYLFDTFEGMSAPSQADARAADGEQAATLLGALDRDALLWCNSSLDEVKANVRTTDYPSDLVTYVQGKVEDTIPANAPDRIAVLRLDTDWYESTKHELEHLYPRLVSGGLLIIDDYGYWLGARKAVDEYFAGTRTFLNRIDDTGRLVIKP